MIQLTLTLKVTTSQVVETSVTVNNNSPIQDYVHSDDHAQPSYEMTYGLKYFTIIKKITIIIIIVVLVMVTMMISEVYTLLFNISIQHHSWLMPCLCNPPGP